MESPARPTSEEKPSSADEARPLPPWRSRRFRLTLALILTAVLVGLMIKSQVPHLAAAWHRYSVQQYLAQEKLDEALQECDRALAWLPESPDLYELRGDIHLERGDCEAALKDYNELLRLNPHFPQGYQRRGFVHQLLGQHDKAIEDAKARIDGLGEEKPDGFNQLAYTRAVAGVELDAALADAERALKLLGHNAEAVPAEVKTTADKDLQWADYMDTRGYIHFRQDKHKDALDDLDRAIAVFTRVQKAALERMNDQSSRRAALKKMDEHLAIMYQHRGLVYEKLGDATKAQADKEKAKELGYDPKRHGQ